MLTAQSSYDINCYWLYNNDIIIMIENNLRKLDGAVNESSAD